MSVWTGFSRPIEGGQNTPQGKEMQSSQCNRYNDHWGVVIWVRVYLQVA